MNKRDKVLADTVAEINAVEESIAGLKKKMSEEKKQWEALVERLKAVANKDPNQTSFLDDNEED